MAESDKETGRVPLPGDIVLTYTPPSELIIHEVDGSLDHRERSPDVVHIMQYDNNYPIIAVNLLADYQSYRLPDPVSINVRMHKPDGKNVYNPVLGISSDRHTVYFAVTLQMTTAYGRGLANVEIIYGDRVIGTAPIIIDIDPNPVQGIDIESSDEYKTFIGLIDEANAAAERAKESQIAAENSEGEARMSAYQANFSAITAETAAGLAAKSQIAAEEAAETAKQYSTKPPVIIDGTWWVWNAEQNAYTDTGVNVGSVAGGGLVDENSGKGVRMWFGTVAEYNALSIIEPDVYYNILEGTP